MEVLPHYPIGMHLILKELLNLEVNLKLSRYLFIESEAFVIQDRRALVVSYVNQHVCVRKIFTMALDQHRCRVWES